MKHILASFAFSMVLICGLGFFLWSHFSQRELSFEQRERELLKKILAAEEKVEAVNLELDKVRNAEALTRELLAKINKIFALPYFGARMIHFDKKVALHANHQNMFVIEFEHGRLEIEATPDGGILRFTQGNNRLKKLNIVSQDTP